MGIAHGRADILVAEQFLDFPQILSHLVEEDRGRGVAQPMRGDLPYPEGSTGGPQPQIERPVGKRRARISRIWLKRFMNSSLTLNYFITHLDAGEPR